MDRQACSSPSIPRNVNSLIVIRPQVIDNKCNFLYFYLLRREN